MTTTELEFAEALVRLAHTVQHMFADASREHDLTPQQAQLLCVLIDEPVGMTELSRLLHLEKSSLTGLVDRVERRGLVARVRDDRDRRACRIALTDEGVALAYRTHQAVTARIDERTRPLPAAARSHVLAALDALSR